MPYTVLNLFYNRSGRLNLQTTKLVQGGKHEEIVYRQHFGIGDIIDR